MFFKNNGITGWELKWVLVILTMRNRRKATEIDMKYI